MKKRTSWIWNKIFWNRRKYEENFRIATEKLSETQTQLENSSKNLITNLNIGENIKILKETLSNIQKSQILIKEGKISQCTRFNK